MDTHTPVTTKGAKKSDVFITFDKTSVVVPTESNSSPSGSASGSPFDSAPTSAPTSPTRRVTPRVGHQFSILDYGIGAGTSTIDLFQFLRTTASSHEEEEAISTHETEVKEDIVKTLSSSYTRITAKRKRESLRNFFIFHKKEEWSPSSIPTPPSFPIEDIPKHYRQFHIPKKSGGLREINAPDDELKKYLTSLKSYLEDTLQILPHDAAHAYVKSRSCKTAVVVHQKNNSHFFLKLDMKNFFPSHDLDYVMDMLSRVYPLCFLFEEEDYYTAFKKAISYAFLNNSLPQGTPLSPTLTNTCMVPIDFNLKKALKAKGPFIYTRYADDILVSSFYSFKFTDIENLISEEIKKFSSPFFLNTKKTRYGSSAGSNWNLGMMLNKDNQITIGHKANKRFKAMLFNLFTDYTKQIYWESHDRQELIGIISYYKSINRETTERIISTYENKFNLKLKVVLKGKPE